MEHMINEHLIVDEPEMAENQFSKFTGCELDWGKVNEYVNSNTAATIHYLDENLKMSDKERAMFVWVDIGARNGSGKPIFLSLLNRDGYYSGHFLGTGEYLVNGMCNRNVYRGKTYRDNFHRFEKKFSRAEQKRGYMPKPVFDRPAEKLIRPNTGSVEDINNAVNEERPTILKEFDTKMSAVTEEIYADLLFPTWNSVEGLDTYIKVIGRRIPQLLETGRTEYLLQNKLGNVIVNTGLMDIYGTDFLILYRKYAKQESYKAYRIMQSRIDYEEEGFTREDSSKELKPITFFEAGEALFSAAYEDFDINMRCLKHIVEERRDRFPERLQSESSDRIARTVVEALRIGLKIQERDPGYARAIYTDGRISWLLPLRIETLFTEEPELALVMRKEGGYFQLKTILPYDGMLKDRITSTGLYRKSW